MFLRNIGVLRQHYTPSKLRELWSESSPPC